MTNPVVIAPLRVAVFDEVPSDAQALADLIKGLQLPIPVEVTPVYHTTGLPPLIASGIDLLLMDFGQPERPYDGVDIVQALLPHGSRTHVIFTGGDPTARRRIYHVDHLWHLPKPIDILELVDAMEKTLELIERERERPIVLRTGHTDTVVAPHDISYVVSNLRVLSIHIGNQTIDVYGNLSAIANKMPTHFVRCHKSYLVNLDHVSSLGEKTLELDSGEEIPVSLRRHAATREALYAHFGTL